jgi:alpha-methylacyl-CoA racemase
VSPVLSMSEAMTHPHLQARGTFAPWGDGQVPAGAPVFDGKRPDLAAPSRRVGLEEALAAWAQSGRQG